MGAVQSFVTSTEGGVIVAATLVFVGAVEYSTYRTSKQLERGFEKEKGKKGDGKEKGREDKKRGASGDAFDASKARKKKGKKHATAAPIITSSAAEASPIVTATALPIPGDFDTTSMVTPKPKNKSKARVIIANASAQTVEGVEDETSSATPNEAPSRLTISSSGSKPKKSKKKKKLAVGASASTSTLTLPDTSSSKTTLSASNPAAIQPSAVLTSTTTPTTTTTKDPAVRVKGMDAVVSHGSITKDTLHLEEGSATDDEGKPFLASLSSSRQETMGHSRVLGIPPIGTSSIYSDTDSSWTHVQRGGRNNHSSSGPGQLSTSDAGVVSSVTDDGYPSSSPVAERAEDTEEEDTLQTQAQGLGLGSTYVRASEGSDDGSKNSNAPRKTLAGLLETPDNLSPSHTVRLRPLPGEKPVSGFSWADYEDVHVDEGAGHDADGEDDGWGVVRSRRSRLDRGSSTGAGTPTGDAGAGASQAQKEKSTVTKKQRQNAKKREATKAAKAEAEAERLATLVEHKQQLERARMLEQISKSSSKVPSGGMKAAVDGNGKLVWE